MRSKYIFTIILVVALAGLTINAIYANGGLSLKATTNAREALAAHDNEHHVSGELDPTITEAVEVQAAPKQDGASILKSRCTQCHTEQSLRDFKNIRTDWSTILTKMERFGVQLSEPEKILLLDYLPSIAIP